MTPFHILTYFTYGPVALRCAGVAVERVVAERDDEDVALGGAAAQRLAQQRLVLGQVSQSVSKSVSK